MEIKKTKHDHALTLRTMIEILDTLKGEIGEINLGVGGASPVGVKGADLRCGFYIGNYDYLKGNIYLNIDSFYRYSHDENGDFTHGTPAINIKIEIEGIVAYLNMTADEIRSNSETLKAFTYILDRLNELLDRKRARWSKLDSYMDGYDKTLSIKEVDNAKFLCDYIKSRIREIPK